MKKRLISLLLMLSTLFLTSCAQTAVLPIARDIANIQLMRTMALDRGKDGTVKVTVSGDVRPGGEGGSPQPPIILKQEGATVFGAALHIQTYGEGYVSFGHISQCILSAEAASYPNAVADLLDFVVRDFETRISTDFYVTEEESAAKIVTETASENQSTTQRLESLRRDFGLESNGWPVTVREFLLDMSDNGCGLVPVLKLEKNDDGTTIVSSQMAWFQESRFGETLTPAQSREAAILEEKMESGAVELRLRDGTTVGLRLTGERCEWEPVWQGDRLTGLNIRVHLTADLAEEQGKADFYRSEVMDETEQRFNGVIEGQMRELLHLSQKEGADFLHIRRRLAVQCPSKHRILEENWDEWFPALDIRLTVASEIQRSYDIARVYEEEAQ